MAEVNGTAGWDFTEQNIKLTDSVFERHCTVLMGIAIVLRYYAMRGDRENLFEFIKLLGKSIRAALQTLRENERKS